MGVRVIDGVMVSVEVRVIVGVLVIVRVLVGVGVLVIVRVLAWLELNRKVFKAHPEQGRWKEKDLSIRLSEDWFDAAGFFLVEEDQQIIAFCWTKIHSHSHIDNKHHQIGELYITGVDYKYVGKGLGKFLTILGMQHLARKGLHQVLLYTDLENDRAIRLYEKLGFTEISRDVMYKKA